MKISLRLLSLFLAVLICLVLLPVGILANEESVTENSVLASGTVTVSGTASSSDAAPTPTPAPSDSASSTDAKSAPRFTVTYDANGGSGAPASQFKVYGESLTLSSSKPTRSGYIFQGWSSVKNGTVHYSSGGSYTAEESVTLYAVWGFTVSFDANGGSGAPSSGTKLYNQPFTIPTTKPTRSGYTFQGWSATKNGAVQYKAGSTYTSLASGRLYAVWTENNDYNGPTTAGWQKYNGYWYYIGSNGKPLTSQWTKSGGSWYWFKADGRMADNTKITIGGKDYIFKSGGAMATGWAKYNGSWYYANSSGVLKTSAWVKSGGSWYWFKADGRMADNAKLTIGGKDYIFKSGGAMATGWTKYNGSWYYANSSGVLKASAWLKSGGYWYWFKADGRMAAGETLTISSVKYTFNSSGRWVS